MFPKRKHIHSNPMKLKKNERSKSTKKFSEFIGKIYAQFLVINKDAHSLDLD